MFLFLPNKIAYHTKRFLPKIAYQTKRFSLKIAYHVNRFTLIIRHIAESINFFSKKHPPHQQIKYLCKNL